MACFMLEDKPTHYRFSEWPLHLTLAPWFNIDNVDLPKFIDLLDNLFDQSGPLMIRLKDKQWFGHNREVPVMIVDDNERLIKLHESLLSGINQIGRIIATDHTGNNYRPHITLKDNHKLTSGRKFDLNKIYIVSGQNNCLRQIVQVINMD